MKPSFTTWRLSFASPPSPQQLRDVRALLEPIARVDIPADHGLLLQEYGLSDHLFIEPPAERTAGKIALDCLRKAHRLGVGWSGLWPGVPRQAGGWAAEDWRRAAWPESLDGLYGGLSDGEAPGRSHVAGLQAASLGSADAAQNGVAVREAVEADNQVTVMAVVGGMVGSPEVFPNR